MRRTYIASAAVLIITAAAAGWYFFYHLNCCAPPVPCCAAAPSPAGRSRQVIAWKVSDPDHSITIEPNPKPASQISWDARRELIACQAGRIEMSHCTAANTYLLKILTVRRIGSIAAHAAILDCSRAPPVVSRRRESV
jgi:hypothetical protein